MANKNEALVAAYKAGIKRINAELATFALSDMSRAIRLATLKAIADILAEINGEASEWVEKHVTEAVRLGIIDAIIATGAAKTVAEAAKIVSFNRANQALIDAVITDTYADLLAVTQNIDRRTRAAVRQASATVMRENMAAGINGRKTIGREIMAELRKTLGNAVETGIVDAGGRRWRPETYVDMVTRTKIAEAQRESTANEAVQRGVFYGVISSHGATDACARWEGKIVKLTMDAAGEYPYIGDLPRREIFHPNCKHLVTPIRNPEKLTEGGM